MGALIHSFFAGIEQAMQNPFLISSTPTTQTISLISTLYPNSKTCLADQDKKAELTSM
jgi:hypothetical protein